MKNYTLVKELYKNTDEYSGKKVNWLAGLGL